MQHQLVYKYNQLHMKQLKIRHLLGVHWKADLRSIITEQDQDVMHIWKQEGTVQTQRLQVSDRSCCVAFHEHAFR